MNPYLIIAALVAILAAGAGGFKLGADHEIAAKAREDKHITEAIEAATITAAKAIAAQSPVFTTINQKVRHEVSTNTVFADCRLPDTSLQLVNQALNGGAIPASRSELPKADPSP